MCPTRVHLPPRHTVRRRFLGDRQRIRLFTVQMALDLLRRPHLFPAGVELVDVGLAVGQRLGAPELHGGGQFALLDGKIAR